MTEYNPPTESVMPELQVLRVLQEGLERLAQHSLHVLQEQPGGEEPVKEQRQVLWLQQRSAAQKLQEMVERLEMRQREGRYERLEQLVHVGELAELVRLMRLASLLRPSMEARELLAGLEQTARRLKLPIPSGPAYQADFAGWAKHQADMVRMGNWEEIDQEHLVEELEALSRSEHDALESRLEVLITHLLKWRFDVTSQEPRRGWRLTIREQRRRLARLLHRSPGLRSTLPDVLAESYPHARLMAIDETDLPEATLPESCPWTLAQVLDAEFWPEGPQVEQTKT